MLWRWSDRRDLLQAAAEEICGPGAEAMPLRTGLGLDVRLPGDRPPGDRYICLPADQVHRVIVRALKARREGGRGHDD